MLNKATRQSTVRAIAYTKSSSALRTAQPFLRTVRGSTPFTAAISSTVWMSRIPRWSAATLVTTAMSQLWKPRPERSIPPRAVSSTA